MATKAELAKISIMRAITFTRREFIRDLFRYGGKLRSDGTYIIRRPIVDKLKRYLESSDSELEERYKVEAEAIADRIIDAIDKE